MVNLNPTKTDNPGGLSLCFFAEWHSIDWANFPAADGLKLIGDIPLLEGHVWYQLFFTPYTADFDLSHTEDRHGVLYRHGLKGAIRPDSPELANALYDMGNRRFVLLFKDHNGYLRASVCEDNPLKFTYKYTTGNNPGATNGNDFTLSGESLLPAYFYSGSFEVSEVGVISPPPSGGSGEPVIIRKSNGDVVAQLLPGQVFIINSGFSWGFNIL